MLKKGSHEPSREPPLEDGDTGVYVLVIVGLVMIAAILAVIGISLR